MKFVLSHQKGKDGKRNVERRECTRIIKYKGLHFAVCPNRVYGGRPYSYDIFEVSTGLPLGNPLFRLKDAYPYIRDNFYFITKELKKPFCLDMMKEICEYVAENGEVDLMVDMQTVFNCLREMGIIDTLLI